MNTKSNKNKFTRNQIISIVMAFIALLGVILNSIFDYLNYTKLSDKQTYIIQQTDQIESKVGAFNKLITSGIWFDNSSYPWIFSNGSHVIIGRASIWDYNESCSGISRKTGSGGFFSCDP